MLIQGNLAQMVMLPLREEQLGAVREIRAGRVAPLVQLKRRWHQPGPEIVQRHLVREVTNDPLSDLVFQRWHGRHSV